MNKNISKDDLNPDTGEPVNEPEQKTGRPRDKPYSGILAQPMVLDFSEGDTAACLKVFPEKVIALFDHFQVERWDFVKLALELAARHVPGFQFQKPAGAPTRWLPTKQALLIRAVRRYQVNKAGSGASITAACRHIAVGGLFGRASAGTLERRYYEAIKDDDLIRYANRLIALEAADPIAFGDKKLVRLSDILYPVEVLVCAGKTTWGEFLREL